VWENQRDEQGVSSLEKREDYKRFDDVYVAGGNGLYIPPGWTGKMPNGDVISAGKSFLDIRSFYKNDPEWGKVQAYLDGGAVPEFRYHRFWAQTAIATALADYDRFFEGSTGGTTDGGTTDGGTTDGGTTDGGTTDGTPQPAACTASYATHGNWGSGFQGGINVTASKPITSWTLTFNLGGATINNIWGEQATGSGTYTVKSESWNGTLSTGQSATVGFIGNGSAPSAVSVTCN